MSAPGAAEGFCTNASIWLETADFLRFNSPRAHTITLAAPFQAIAAPGSPVGLIDPISGTMGTLEYDHGDGISITAGFMYRGTAIPALVGKYVFGDLAMTGSPCTGAKSLFARWFK